ncbi:MAG: TetR/AcrR family transcriptional regulator [Bacteroidales bacterium]|nr:TetR/AcrR family transcriptional regulator [Bacteroidales bacterium]
MDYKKRILEEAAVLFRDFGMKAVTMDMIAGKMGISKRTIYEVFKDKDELLKGVMQLMYEKQHTAFTNILNDSGNTIEAIFKMIDLMINHFQNMSPAFLLEIKRYHNDVFKKSGDHGMFPYLRNNEEIIERGIKEGLFRNDIDINITNKCMLEAVRMSTDKDLFPPEEYVNKDVIKNVYISYLRGISTKKGIEMISLYERHYKNKK